MYESKLVDSSRMLADMLVTDIGTDPCKFSAMMNIAMRDEYPTSMRAARVIALCIEKHNELICDYIPALVENISRFRVDGVRRGFLKIIAEQPLNPDEESVGRLADLAFTWLNDPKQAISIRYYCIDILVKITKQYPEIGNELSECLKSLFEEGSPGLKSKSKQILILLKKL